MSAKASTPARANEPNLGRLDFEPAMTEEEVFSAEAAYNEKWGLPRRLTMMTMARTRIELVNGFLEKDKGPDLMLYIVEQIQEYRNHLQASVEMADSAMDRIFIALSAAKAIEGDPTQLTVAAAAGLDQLPGAES